MDYNYKVYIVGRLFKELDYAFPDFPIDKVIPITRWLVEHPDYFEAFWQEFKFPELELESLKYENIMSKIVDAYSQV